MVRWCVQSNIAVGEAAWSCCRSSPTVEVWFTWLKLVLWSVVPVMATGGCEVLLPLSSAISLQRMSCRGFADGGYGGDVFHMQGASVLSPHCLAISDRGCSYVCVGEPRGSVCGGHGGSGGGGFSFLVASLMCWILVGALWRVLRGWSMCLLSASLPFEHIGPRWGWCCLGGAMPFDYGADPTYGEGAPCEIALWCISTF